MFSHLAMEHIETRQDRVMILVHRDELADQAMDKIRTVAPHLRVGKVKAGDNEIHADVVVASVQTASRKDRLNDLYTSQFNVPAKHPQSFGLVITDEVHHCVAASYRKIYDAFPRAWKAGFTATLARGDGVGLGDVIDSVVYQRSWLWMIKNGYLVDPVAQVVTAEDLDLSQVVRSGRGDYTGASLGAAMTDARAHEVIARAYAEHAAERSGIVFAPNVATARLIAGELSGRGITAAVVEASTPREERQEIYGRSRTGALQVIVNVGVLTEGFDAPWIDCVVPRMTMSAPLWQQMVGRGLRPFPGKDDCLVLSVGGIGGRLRTLVDLEPGSVREVRPGESLAEAAERTEAENNAALPGAAAPFRIKVKHADLFAGSRSVWLRTEGGVMFIPVTDGEVFLWPGRDGTWQVRHAPHNTARRKLVWPVLHDGLSLDLAMAWGETEAEDRDHGKGRAASVSSRSAAWRRKGEPPTPGQLAACSVRSIPVPDGASRGEVGDLLSVWNATRKFDHFAARLAQRTTVSAG
jgi:superfamily II DNA or RNA helicase